MSLNGERVARWLRRALAALVGVVLALWLVARVQLGRSPETDAGWRRRVRGFVPTTEVPPIGRGRWARRLVVPRSAGGVCDLASTPRGLALATSLDPLTRDGAALLRWDGRRLDALLRWEGQGFVRVHAFGDTLVVPDADAPFRALPFAFDLDVDGYVFVSGPDGALPARAREVLPAAYHVFDVAPVGGRLVASTGAYPPSGVAYVDPAAPAALFADDGAGRPWRRILEFPSPRARGVYRFTFLHAVDDDTLLAGYTGPDGVGAVRVTALASRRPAVARVAGIDGFVLRWIAWRGDVLAVVQADGTSLRRSRDGGRSFGYVATPGSPQSAVAAGDALILLADGALLRSADGESFEAIAPSVPALAHRPSTLVSAPLIVHRRTVWTASPATGEVFALEPSPTAPGD